LFELINNNDIELMYRKLISNTINKMKNNNEDFELEDYINILNTILKYHKIDPIEDIEVKREISEKNTYNILNIQDIPPSVNNIKLTANTVNIINNQVPNMFLNNNRVRQPLGFGDLFSNTNGLFNNINSMYGNSDIYRQLYASLILKQQMNNLPNIFHQDMTSYYNMLMNKLLHTTHIANTGINMNMLLTLLGKNNNAPQEAPTPIQLEEQSPPKSFLGKKNKKEKKSENSNRKNNSSNDNTITNIQTSEKKEKNKRVKGLQRKESHFLENEKPLPLKGELEKYEPLYKNEKEEICRDPAHSFMSEHFPEMYRIDNFYVNIITRKQKWNKRKKEYIIGVKNDYTIFQNIVEEKTIEMRENDMIKVWDPSFLSEKQGKLY
jgi:hypothetical protein